MGFHRRIINSEVTDSYLKEEKLSILYSSESLIFMDKKSSKIFDLYKSGKKENEILEIIKNEKYEDNHGN
jgi:hypothetical protein